MYYCILENSIEIFYTIASQRNLYIMYVHMKIKKFIKMLENIILQSYRLAGIKLILLIFTVFNIRK